MLGPGVLSVSGLSAFRRHKREKLTQISPFPRRPAPQAAQDARPRLLRRTPARARPHLLRGHAQGTPLPPPVSARPRADDDITTARVPAHSQLIAAVSARVQRDSADAAEVDVMGWMARAALELIRQTGIGYSFDPLVSDSADEFGAAVKATQ